MNDKPLRRRQTVGFTLYETLLGIAIVTIALGSTASLVVQGIRSQAASQRLAAASTLAQNELEYWKAAGPLAVAQLQNGTQPFANPSYAADRTATGTLNVVRVDDRLVQLEAVAELPSLSTRPMRVSMCTWMIAERQP